MLSIRPFATLLRDGRCSHYIDTQAKLEINTAFDEERMQLSSVMKRDAHYAISALQTEP